MTLKATTIRTKLSLGRIGLFALALCTAGAFALPATAQPTSNSPVTVDQDDSSYAGYVTVPLGKSRILRVNSSVKDLLIGNSDVADVMPLTNKSVYVLGKQIGSTSLSILGPGKKLIAVVDIRVSHDTRSLKRDLHEILPGQVVEVRAANDSIILSGTVSSSSDASQAAAVAERYAPGKVSNFLGITESQQVMLSVRFAEVKRNVAKQLGLNSTVDWDNGNGHSAGMVSGIINPDAFATITGTKMIGESDVSLILDALEEKGIVTTLAEPTLIAKSGETANFLAGGEFPVPVPRTSNNADDAGSITIEFKEYGASLAFTPTVLGETISLIVEPEVSQLDFQSAIELAGYRVPGLTTRRAKTSVEMKNGQSFAIAGLLQTEFTDRVSQLPGIGDIPILGSLVRSTEFERNETELVIIITPHFVKPVNPKDLKMPTDYVVKPHDLELFLAGVVESSRLNRFEGIDGAVGYIIE